MILSGDFVVTSASKAPIPGGAVAIDNGKVVATGVADDIRHQYPAMPVVGGPGHVVIPGLIDAHQHGRGITNIQRGVADGPLERWRVRLRGAWPVPPYPSTALAALALLRTGVTTTLHHYTSGSLQPPDAEPNACLAAYRDSGMRATFTVDFADTNFYTYSSDSTFIESLPLALAERVKRQVPPRNVPKPAQAFALLETLRGVWESERLKFALGPQSLERGCEADFRLIADYARANSLPFHTHTLETKRQRDESLRLFGVSPVARLAQFGLLTETTSLAHMVWASDDDLTIMADHGASIVHNPASNLRLRSGTAPVQSMLRKGIAVGIGMDSMSLSDRSDFFEDLRLCSGLHFDDKGALDSADVWRMVYEGGRRAAFWNDSIGELTPGRWGDAVVLRLSDTDTKASVDPGRPVMDRVLREASPGKVAAVIVGGQIVMKDGMSTLVDENRLIEQAHAAAIDVAALAERRETIAMLEKAIDAHFASVSVLPANRF